MKPQAFELRTRRLGPLPLLNHYLDRLGLAELLERSQSEMDELHNDSTTVRFTGQYKEAKGRSLRCKKAPFITYGYSKDHRHDLKQLLFIPTSTEDGGVPVQLRCEAGNQNDSRTHEESWEAPRRVAGRTDFLHVADSKLCGAEAMEHIHRRGGRFVTVMPRSRGEDKEFRAWIQDHEPDLEKVWDRPNPRRKGGPRDRWLVWRHHLPSREGWPVIWVFSTLLGHKQAESRRERMARAQEELGDLAHHYLHCRPRRRAKAEVWKQITSILEARRVSRYLKVTLGTLRQHADRQERRGRPGPDTKYRRVTTERWQITCEFDEEAIAYDHRSDGMYPLLSNDRSPTPSQVLEAHKRQPVIESRFKQAKTVHEIGPVLLKNEGRIGALFFLYSVALLITALLERDLQRAMVREEIDELPLYPEERKTKRPTAEQVLGLFSLLQRHRLYQAGKEVQVFSPNLTELQTQVLSLLGVPPGTCLALHSFASLARTGR
jgi:transposase